MRYIYILFVCFFCICSYAFGYKSKLFTIPTLGNSIYEGVFTGNGLLGTMLYQKSANSLRIDVGRTDVYDHRKDGNYVLFSSPRLLIGHFEISFKDATKSRGEINLIDAQATAFANNGITVKTVTLAEKDIIIIRINKNTSSDQYQINFVPEEARSPRFNFDYTKKPEQYEVNPAVITYQSKDIFCIQQPLLAGGGYLTAYKQIQSGDEDIYIATVTYSTSGEDYVANAIHLLETIDPMTIDDEMINHRFWWDKYNQQSTYSVPDSSMQAFYDMQLYKLACATRADAPALDLQGPWTSNTPWPAYWYNLNMQLTYSPLYTANRLEIAESLIRLIDVNKKQLIKNVHLDYQHNSAGVGRIADPFMNSPISLHTDHNLNDDQYAEMTNLIWLLHYYYKHYRHSMDDVLKDNLYDLLKRSVNLCIHLLKKNASGIYEFSVKSHSPEYPKSYDYNTNYDLSNLRWGLKTLQELGNNNEKETDYLAYIKDIDANLIPYPVGPNGFKISTNQSYDVSHRHYSHLLMIYPYYLINADQKENVDVIKRSVEYWQSKKEALQGYSLSGAASMFAMMGDGDRALNYLRSLLNQFVQPNTLYKESGPVIETPLAMAQSLQELSLQYWDGVLRIFPAIPKDWKVVSFSNFLTEGAFLVSATRKNGQTEEIKLKAQKAGDITIKHGFHSASVSIIGKGDVVFNDGDLIKVKLQENDVVFITHTKIYLKN